MTTATTNLLDPQVWTGKIFNGEWIVPSSGEYQVSSPPLARHLGYSAGPAPKTSREQRPERQKHRKAGHVPHFRSGRVCFGAYTLV
jgi:hypothetical protein